MKSIIAIGLLGLLTACGDIIDTNAYRAVIVCRANAAALDEPTKARCDKAEVDYTAETLARVKRTLGRGVDE